MKKDKNISTFNFKSEKYKSARPLYPNEIYELISKHCKNRESAWDCACGSGQVSKSLVDYFKRVSASDLNINQIENSYRHPNINYTVQDSEKTNFKDLSFDLVCVAQAMHWFNIDIYFKEVKRVLKKRGIFACWGYSFFKIEPNIDKVVKEIILDPIKPYWSENNKILWNNYSDIAFPFKKIETPKIEMKESWSKFELIEYIKTWSAYKRFEADNSRNIIKEFLNNTELLWLEESKLSVKMDFTLYLGINS